MELKKKLLTVTEAAEYLGIKIDNLYRLTMQRKIAFIKVGKLNRFRIEDLERFIQENTFEPIN